MHLSVIIVSWNTSDLLKKCIASVLVYTDPNDCEIIVVDNASNDDTVSMIQEKFPEIKLIVNKKNIGFSRANNLGIDQSQGRYILLLNPDTLVKQGAIPKLIEFLEATPLAAAVGPFLVNPDGTLQYSCSPAPTFTSEFKRLFHFPGIRPDGYYDMETWDTATPRSVDVLLGACLLIRMTALDSVGFFDEDYYMYSEESDLCQRLRNKGWQLFWVPEAQVIHYGGQSTQQVASDMFINLYRSKVIYFYKHFGKSEAGYYQILLKFVALSRLLAAMIVWLFCRGKRGQQSRLFKNYQRLLFQSFNY